MILDLKRRVLPVPPLVDARACAQALRRDAADLQDTRMAGQPQGQVEDVDAEIDERTSALDLLVGERAPRGDLTPAQGPCAHHVDVAQFTGIDDALRRPRFGLLAVPVSRRQDAPGLARDMHNVARFSRSARQRLLTEYVQTVAHRRHGDRGMVLVGRTDADRIQVFALQHLPIIGVDGRNAKGRGGTADSLGHGVRRGHHHNPLIPLVARQMAILGNTACSNDPHPHAVPRHLASSFCVISASWRALASLYAPPAILSSPVKVSLLQTCLQAAQEERQRLDVSPQLARPRRS